MISGLRCPVSHPGRIRFDLLAGLLPCGAYFFVSLFGGDGDLFFYFTASDDDVGGD